MMIRVIVIVLLISIAHAANAQNAIRLPAGVSCGNASPVTGAGQLYMDDHGNLCTQAPFQSALNITSATNVKASAGRIGVVCLNTAASTASSVIDSTDTSVTAANTILTIPSTVTAGTCYRLDWPTTTGISVVPGTSGVLSISYQ